MKIAVVYSLPVDGGSEERVTDSDTQDSALEVAEALRVHGHEVLLYPVKHSNLKILETIKADCLFNLLEWTGRYTPVTVEAMRILERRSIPFTGATPANFALTTDKEATKRVLAKLGYPTAAWVRCETGQTVIPADFPFPALVKLTSEHCSVSLEESSLVHDASWAKQVINQRKQRYQQPVYLEQFLPGREFHATLLEKDGRFWVLPLAEIVYKDPTSYNFLTFAGRWHTADPAYNATTLRLAEMGPSFAAEISQACQGVFRDLAFRDYARFDIRCDENGRFYFLEVNCNPGLGDSDDYTMTHSYKAAGLTFADVVLAIVQSCQLRWPSQNRATRSLPLYASKSLLVEMRNLGK